MAYRARTDKPIKRLDESAREKNTFKKDSGSYKKKEDSYRGLKKAEKSEFRPGKPDYRNKPKSQKPESAEPVQAVQTETDELPYLLIGRNAVREAIRAGRSIDKILVST